MIHICIDLTKYMIHLVLTSPNTQQYPDQNTLYSLVKQREKRGVSQALMAIMLFFFLLLYPNTDAWQHGDQTMATVWVSCPSKQTQHFHTPPCDAHMTTFSQCKQVTTSRVQVVLFSTWLPSLLQLQKNPYPPILVMVWRWFGHVHLVCVHTAIITGDFVHLFSMTSAEATDFELSEDFFFFFFLMERCNGGEGHIFFSSFLGLRVKSHTFLSSAPQRRSIYC